MALELLRHLAWTPSGRRKIRILQTFRRIRETLADQDADNVTARQYEESAAELNISAAEVRMVTHEWLEQRPLPFIAACAEPGVGQLFAQLRRAGLTVAVLSDYPAVEKLEILDLPVDIIVSAVDPNVDRFKPHPQGLATILASTQIPPEQTVLIGDRMERDGLCAQRCGVRFMLKGPGTSRGTEGFRDFGELAPMLLGPEVSASRGNFR